MKRLYNTSLVYVFLMLCSTSYAQQDLNIFNVDDWSTKITEHTMYVTWQSQLASSGDVFVVEKLDKDWNYFEVGRVKAAEAFQPYRFRLADNQPMDGENYYRITLMKANGTSLVSEMMIADYFQPATKEFEFIFNDRFANYAALHHLNSMPKEVGIFGSSKFSNNTLKLRRIKAQQYLPFEEKGIKDKSLVATID